MDHRPSAREGARRRTGRGALARRGVLGGLCALALVSGCTAQQGAATASTTSSLFDDAVVHEVEVVFDEVEYDAMIAAFETSGDKEWITATVTIDGSTYQDVGLRLKGNSSLQGLRQSGGGAAGDGAAGDAGDAGDGAAGGGAGPAGIGGEVSADDPETLPWLIRLDKFVDGQEHEGLTQVVVRSNNTESSLNEAVALELVELAGLASQDAAAARFSVNGSDERLRLLVQNPDDAWDTATFGTEGVLYKAESGGDYSYRGEDPEAYEDVFDQETDTDEEDLSPLIDFLRFINEADDATFAAELDQHLDVEAFTQYLAVQELLANTDDIDGPGNNSYLRYDEESGTFTVVTWDLNLALGGFGAGGFGPPGMGGGDGAGGPGADGLPEGFVPPEGMDLPEGFVPPEGMEMPDGFVPPEGMEMPEGGGGFGGPGGANILVERYMAVPELAAAYEQALVDLEEQLYGSGAAQEVLDRWTEVLQDQASDLVDAETLATESAAVAEAFTSATVEEEAVEEATGP